MSQIELLAMCEDVLMKKTCAIVYACCFSISFDEVVHIFGDVIEVYDMLGRGVWNYEL